MRKLFSAAAVCALVVGLTVAPSGVAKKGTKLVNGTVSVFAAPSAIAPDTPAVMVSGNVKTNSSCRKDRVVHLFYSSNPGTDVGLVETGPNGDYTALVPKPMDEPPAMVVLQARVGEQFRKVGSKKKGKKDKPGRKFLCREIVGQSGLLNVTE